MRRGLADEQRGQIVAAQAAVAIGPAPFRRDDVRRVARDQVERLAHDRLEEASDAALDVVEAVQRGVQLRVCERARIDVDRDHLAVAPRGEKRMDAAAGADVERAPATLAHRQHVARARGRRVARDVVRRIVGVAREPVGGEQHVGDRDEARGRHDVAAELGEPGDHERLDGLPAERVDRLRLRHRQLEEQEPDRRAEPRLRQPPRRDEHVLRLAGVRVLVEQVVERVLRVVELAQRSAERRGGRTVGGRSRHRPMMSYRGCLDGADRRG